MKKIKIGFTLVEVSLFLAITAAIFVGVAVGTSNSIFQQRYNDSVQSFVEFLRTVYSQVTNVQSKSAGNSQDTAIYGKLVIFSKSGGKNVIKTYNAIGNLSCSNATSNMLELLECLNIRADIDGYTGEYVPRWGSQIQTKDPWGSGYGILEGLLLIVRSPESGSVYTYFSEEYSAYDEGTGSINFSSAGFSDTSQVDFCINPNGADKSNLRKDIRLTANARNASGIEVIGDAENQCQ